MGVIVHIIVVHTRPRGPVRPRGPAQGGKIGELVRVVVLQLPGELGEVGGVDAGAGVAVGTFGEDGGGAGLQGGGVDGEGSFEH